MVQQLLNLRTDRAQLDQGIVRWSTSETSPEKTTTLSEWLAAKGAPLHLFMRTRTGPTNPRPLIFDFKPIPDALSDAEILDDVVRNQWPEEVASWSGELRTERERFLRHSSEPPLDLRALANMARQRIRFLGPIGKR